MTKPIKFPTFHAPQVGKPSRFIPQTQPVPQVRRVQRVPQTQPVPQVPQVSSEHPVRIENHAEITRPVQQPVNVDTANGSIRKAEPDTDQMPVKPTSPIYVPEEDLITTPPPGFVPVTLDLRHAYTPSVVIEGRKPMIPLVSHAKRDIKNGAPAIVANVLAEELNSEGMYYPSLRDLEKYDFYLVGRNWINKRPRKIKLTPKHLKRRDFIDIFKKKFGTPTIFSHDNVIAGTLRAVYEHGKPISPEVLESLVQYAHKHPFNPNIRGPFNWIEPNFAKGQELWTWDPDKQEFVNIGENRYEYATQIFGGKPITKSRYVYRPELGKYEIVQDLESTTDGVHNMFEKFPRGFRYYDGSYMSHTSTDSTPLLWKYVSRHVGTKPGEMFADFVRDRSGNIESTTTNSLGDAGVKFNDLMKDPKIKPILSKVITDQGDLDINYNFSDTDKNTLYNLVLPYYESVGIQTSDRLKKVFGKIAKSDPKLNEGIDMISHTPMWNQWLRELLQKGEIKVRVNIPRMMFGKYKQGGRFYPSLQLNKKYFDKL